MRIEEGFDVVDPASIQAFADRIRDLRVDILINNAGILTAEALPSIDFDAVLRQLEVNALGPLRVTQALLPNLADGAKIAIITSRMGSLADNTSGGMYGYRMSKAAVNAAGRSLAFDLRDKGFAVQLLHPGFVQTEMTGGQGHVTPEESAAGLIQRIDELKIDATGTFRHANGETLPW